jgi:hypothetical protein
MRGEDERAAPSATKRRLAALPDQILGPARRGEDT